MGVLVDKFLWHGGFDHEPSVLVSTFILSFVGAFSLERCPLERKPKLRSVLLPRPRRARLD